MTGPVGVSVLPHASTTVGGVGNVAAAAHATVLPAPAGTVKSAGAATVNVAVQVVDSGAHVLE